MPAANLVERWAWLTLGCAGLCGCALLPVAGLNLAAQGAQGLVALTLGPLADMQDGAQTDRCAGFAGMGIAVTESLETATPTGEGEVATYAPAHWRPEYEREGYPQVERARTPAEGTLAISDRSVRFAEFPGTSSVRIPYELVQNVDVHRSAVTGEPRSMIVKSCFGRYDIVTFHRPSDALDTEATIAAAARLEARVAAFRTAAGR
jgi:hypothetical protein